MDRRMALSTFGVAALAGAGVLASTGPASAADDEGMRVITEAWDETHEVMGAVHFRARMRVYHKPDRYPGFAAYVQFGVELRNTSGSRKAVGYRHHRLIASERGQVLRNEDDPYRTWTLAAGEHRSTWFGLRHGFAKYDRFVSTGRLVRNGQASPTISRAEWVSPEDNWHLL